MLRLEGTVELHQIQMLSHEHKVNPCHHNVAPRHSTVCAFHPFHAVVLSEAGMHFLCDAALMMQIASKVELHVGTQHGEAVSWKRLGSFSFDSNERSKLQSRELKSVTVSVQALFLRIVLARCHMNSQNIYKQARVSANSCSASALCHAAVIGTGMHCPSSYKTLLPLCCGPDTGLCISVGGHSGIEHQWQSPARGHRGQRGAAFEHINSRGGGFGKTQSSSGWPCLASARDNLQR